MDGTKGEISAVDDAEGTPGMNDITSGVNDEATPGVDTPGVDDDAPDTTNKSDDTKIEPTNVERMSGAMNLRRQPRKQYNRKNYNNVFNVTDETQKTLSYSCSSNTKKTWAPSMSQKTHLTRLKTNICS